MQKAEHILSLLGQKSMQRPDFVFPRFYRYLYNPDLYVKAMEQCPPSDCKSMRKQVEELIQQLRMERCDWQHPLKVALLKHAITILLQAIYQPLALPCAKPSKKEALLAIQSTSPPFGWLMEWPTPDVFQQIDSARFGFLLKQKIADGRFVRCVQKLIQVDGWPNEWIDILLQAFDQWLTSQPEDIVYIRYQAHLFLLVRGSKADAQALHTRIQRFWQDHFGLQIFAQPAGFHLFAKKGSFFADYELKVIDDQRIGIFVPITKVNAALRPFQKRGKPAAFSSRIYLPIHRMIELYRREREEFEGFCSMAWNRRKRIKHFRYVHFYSLLKTIARKRNLSVKQVRRRYREQLQRYLA